MEVHTGFEPSTHGFHFRNRFSGSDVIDELVEEGRLDELAGLDLPVALENLVGRIRDADFWGAFGLCGGMTWSALDAYLKQRPPPGITSGPERDTELFKLLVARQADSMDRGRTMSRCLRYQLVPEVDSRWFRWRKSLGRITETAEWPTVRQSIDAGIPAPICLVRVRGISNPDKHHQVLVIGYKIDTRNSLTIYIYDPNHPDKSPTISARLGARGHKLDLKQTTGERLHGFFVTDYAAA